ncbi:MAG: hypothetical protein U1B84_05325 [Variovorax sp.]|nr:hypothetical protein [Variovorax sp.]
MKTTLTVIVFGIALVLIAALPPSTHVETPTEISATSSLAATR